MANKWWKGLWTGWAWPSVGEARFSWRAFRVQFQRRRDRGRPEVGDLNSSEGDRRALATSLAVFQCGEAGEGRIAREVDTIVLPGIDRDYRLCVKLFVAEEARHAALLAEIVRAVGGELLTKNRSENLFRFLRRALGFRFKIVVLLLAEIVGRAYYLTVARVYKGTWLATALEEIAADEGRHLVFHSRFLARASHHAAVPLILALALVCLTCAATLHVAFGHRRALGGHVLTFMSHSIRLLFAAWVRILPAPARQRSTAQKTARLSDVPC